MKMNNGSNDIVNKYNRRDFFKLTAASGLGVALGGLNLPGCALIPRSDTGPVKSPPLKNIRVGFVGVGGRGTSLLKWSSAIEGVKIRAVCDILEDRVARAQRLTEEAGQEKPTGYSRGETDFKRLCQQEDLDMVITATPWRWHRPVCVAAMKAGKHAATEVPAAVTLDECWQLVETSEKYNKYCIMLENCCYSRWMLMVLNMVRQGIFGELVYSECGYMHDLRALYFDLDSGGELLWRMEHSIKRNGNLYPTHGLGPVAQCMNINRGDRFDYLVSMSTKSKGLNFYAAEKFGQDHKFAKQKYALGDINTTLIRTVNGAVIKVSHDCASPRPYSRGDMIQGTKGIFRAYPEQKIYLEGKSPQLDIWEPVDKYAVEYEHPLWKALEKKAEGSGHGGMDFIMLWRLYEALREGTEPDMDVYDAAAWSAVSELSERSVAGEGKPIDFPDFTRGKWKNKIPLGIITV